MPFFSREKTEFTLKQVAKYFEENFKILAPAGSQGDLRLQIAKKGNANKGDGSVASQNSWTSSKPSRNFKSSYLN